MSRIIVILQLKTVWHRESKEVVLPEMDINSQTLDTISISFQNVCVSE